MKWVCKKENGSCFADCHLELDNNCKPLLCPFEADREARWEKVTVALPDWIKVGTWCYIHSGGIGTGKYQKIEVVHPGFVKTKYLVPIENISEARLRPWNDEELKSKVGKVFEMEDGDLTLCLGYQRDRGALYFAGKGPSAYSAKTLAESNWKLNGSPCGILEHKNEQGEWVK